MSNSKAIEFPNSTSKNVLVRVEKTILGYTVHIGDDEYSDKDILKLLANYNESDATEILMLIKIALKRLKLDELQSYGSFTTADTSGTPIYKASASSTFGVFPVEVQVHPRSLQLLVKNNSPEKKKVFAIPPERLIEIAIDHGLLL